MSYVVGQIVYIIYFYIFEKFYILEKPVLVIDSDDSPATVPKT